MIAPDDGNGLVIRLAGDQTMSAAAGLKAVLVRALDADSTGVCVDLDEALEMDITTLQLLWAAERAAAQRNQGFMSRPNASQRALASAAGFERFPGEPPVEGAETPEG